MSKRTLLLIAFLTLLTVFFVYLAISKNPGRPTSKVTPTPTKEPQVAFTTLMLSPQTVALSSRTGSVEVVVDTNGEKNKVTAVQLELSYDPTKLGSVSITPGSFIGSTVPLINTVDQKTGRITYALAIPPSGSGKTGRGIVATISFRSLVTSGTTSLQVLPQTLVTGEGISKSVLLRATGATINFSSSSATTSTSSGANLR